MLTRKKFKPPKTATKHLSMHRSFWKHGLFLVRDDDKINIVACLLLVGLTLAAGIAVYGVMRSQIESPLYRGFETALRGESLFFQSHIDEGLANTHMVSRRLPLIQILRQLNIQPDNATAMRDMKRKIDSLLLDGFTAVAVYDINNNEVMQAGHFSLDQTKILPLKVDHNSFLTWNDNQLTLRVSKDVLDLDGRRVGRIMTEERLAPLTRSFREIREFGKSTEYMLCEALEIDEREIICLISNEDGVEFKKFPLPINGETLPISYALQGESGTITTKDYRQVPVVASYTPAGIFGMVLKQDEKEFYSPMIEQIEIIALHLFVLIVIGILLLYLLMVPLVRRIIRSERMAQERLKESYCLHGIRRDTDLNLKTDEFCQKVITRLIEAMQFPEIASVMIELGDKKFVSDRYNKDLMHRLQAQILVKGKAYGCLHVVYSKDQPFWLPEEQDLIDSIASVLGKRIEREQAEQRIMQMATHDALTGLPNRHLLKDRIKQVLAHDRRRHEQAAVLFVDLDNFKMINDSLGHAMGDLLLQEVAARLNAIIRCEDTVVRHGGDEFILLLPNITGSQEAKVVAQKILNELTRTFHIQGEELHIGGSIGIALFPSDGNDMETLLKCSDVAMYYAKKSGRNNYQFFSPEMNQKTIENTSVA